MTDDIDDALAPLEDAGEQVKAAGEDAAPAPVAGEEPATPDEPTAAPEPAEAPAQAAAPADDLSGSLSAEDFAAAVERTVVEFSEGSLVSGTVVRVDPDEVLVDIGFKSEGVIPVDELSIRNNVNPVGRGHGGRADRGAGPADGGSRRGG